MTKLNKSSIGVFKRLTRDRVEKAMSNYKNQKTDTHTYGIVKAIKNDGSYMVQLNASSTLTRCAPCCTAMVGDRVLVLIKADGKCVATGRLGGEIGGGGEVVTTVNDASNYVAGKVFAHAGTNEPIGALLCDGRAVSRTTYWELFDAIGTTYGAGDGESTFNLPNITSRTIIGESSGYKFGTMGGSESHTLTLDEIPSHEGHLQGNNGVSKLGNNTRYLDESVLGTYGSTGRGWWDDGNEIYPAGMSRGGGGAHNNMQPYIVMRYFITTGKGDPVSGINPADYVVEWGNTDGWRWEKWASGKAECWATLTRQDSIQSNFGQFNLSYLSLLMTYPFEFVEEPIVTASANSQDYTLFTTLSGGSTTQTPYVNAARPANAAITTKIDIEYSILAVGLWKDSPASGGTETIAPTIEERFKKLETDYIVAEGPSGDWYYKKYASGWAEMFYGASVTEAVTTSYGSGHHYSGGLPYVFPFTLTEVVGAQASLQGGYLTQAKVTSLNNYGVGVMFMDPLSISSNTQYLSIHAYGWWK